MKITGVHPIAELFPMMSNDELDDLAADIKEHGQLHPMIVDDDGLLIDGRNRRRACEIAGVEPWIEKLNGHDPVALILSSNDRRDLTQGQRAIIAALLSSYNLYKRGEGTKLARALKVPQPRVAEAALIVKHAPDLAEHVRKNELSFISALEKARALKAESATVADQMVQLRIDAGDLADAVSEDRISLAEARARAEQRKQDAALLATIKDRAADLVKLVEEGRMSVTDAVAADASRQEIERNHRQGATTLVAQIIRAINLRHGEAPSAIADRLMEYFDPHQWPASELGDPCPEMFEAASEMLACCAQFYREKENEA
jgi:hypothetical protein